MPAPPPVVRTVSAAAEAVVTRLDGSTFPAPGSRRGRDRQAHGPLGPARPAAGAPGWSCSSTRPTRATPGSCRCSAPGPRAACCPSSWPSPTATAPSPWPTTSPAWSASCPVLLRPGGQRRGQVYLDQDEAWELMTVTGSTLEAAGFDVRVPPCPGARPSPALRLFTEPAGDTMVGARQLSNVRWSAVFDDVELTAAEWPAWPRRPAPGQVPGPLGRARPGRPQGGRGRPGRAGRTTQLTGAEVLRYALGLEGAPLAGGLVVDVAGWVASDLLRRAATSHRARHQPRGLLRPAAGLPGRGPGVAGLPRRRRAGRHPGPRHGPGQDPHGAGPHRPAPPRQRPSLVIAPPAVVGNWAAEAARFTPDLSVVVHHGATRAAADELARRPRAPTSSSPPTAPRCATSRPCPTTTGPRWCWTRRRPSRTPPARPPSSCGASRPAPARAHRHAASRTASATCGRSSTS